MTLVLKKVTPRDIVKRVSRQRYKILYCPSVTVWMEGGLSRDMTVSFPGEGWGVWVHNAGGKCSDDGC